MYFQNGKQSTFAILGMLAIFAYWPSILIYHALPVVILNDSVTYLDLTRYFAAGGFFPDYFGSKGHLHPWINYPMGYPLFLDLCRYFSGGLGWGRAVIFFQHVLSLFSVLLLFMIGQRMGYSKAGFCAALAYALYLPRVLYAQSIMAESLFIFLSLLSVYIFFGILSGKSNMRDGIGLGLAVAYAVLTKPLGVLSVIIFLVYFLVYSVDKRVILGFFFSFAVLVFSNVLYNWHNYGEFALTNTSGSHLANRVIAFDRSIDKNNPETREIISQCRESGLAFRFPSEWWFYLRALRANGLSPREADHLMMQASLAGIRLHPLKFVGNTWEAFKSNTIEEDHWIDQWLLTKQDYLSYLREWSDYRGGALPNDGEGWHYVINLARKFLSPLEFESRHKVLKTMAIDYPQGPRHTLGMRWINLFDKGILKWKGWMAWAFMIAWAYAFFTRDRAMLFLSLFTVINLLLVAVFEAPYPRYFESFVPLAMLSVFLAVYRFYYQCRSGA